MIKEPILLQIEATPGLLPIADVLVGMLVRIQANKQGLKETCGYNIGATNLENLIDNPAKLPCGAHYWHGVVMIAEMCPKCEAKDVCNGRDTIVIKRGERVKCVLIK